MSSGPVLQPFLLGHSLAYEAAWEVSYTPPPPRSLEFLSGHQTRLVAFSVREQSSLSAPAPASVCLDRKPHPGVQHRHPSAFAVGGILAIPEVGSSAPASILDIYFCRGHTWPLLNDTMTL